ncbi:Tfp pilus assembly protein FimT/FimU [Okeania sp. SIO1I7]|uniref:pilus assembly FimT family protein n=1 Tax=Okeania sp. SIO1I7 TaxID=2607772 RepID=UPI0013F9F4D8|nr:type II secretion system protein [Okeania sp. SIO1I7]NET29682.1 type II secretion system protein [Okeania sp. SIO1I7]
MELTILKLLHIYSKQLSTKRTSSNAGFSLIELVVIVLILGILSAIVAPGWNAFITRQRIRTVNSQVLQALQKAQSQAKLKKEEGNVEFNTTVDPPTVIVNSIEQQLNANGEIKAGMVALVVKECETKDADGNCTSYKDDADDQIQFNYLGAIDDPIQELPFAVSVSTPDDGLKRCVIIQTLLGGMRTAEGADCP